MERILRKAGFRSLRSLKKPLLGTLNRARRMKFARKHKNTDWSRIIFSDKKIFRVRPGARVRCWVAPDDSRFKAKYTTPSGQKPEGVMVWAAMKSDGAICLRRCPQKMNSAAYHSVLQSAIGFIRPRCVPHWSHHPMGFCVRRGKGWKFQQDGAPPHRSLSTQAFITRKKVIKFNAGFWPPMSPDLNPIEHLWPLVLRQLNGAVFSGKEQLWAALQEAFAAITPAQVAKLYQSMPKRMLAVRAAKGGATRY